MCQNLLCKKMKKILCTADKKHSLGMIWLTNSWAKVNCMFPQKNPTCYKLLLISQGIMVANGNEWQPNSTKGGGGIYACIKYIKITKEKFPKTKRGGDHSIMKTGLSYTLHIKFGRTRRI